MPPRSVPENGPHNELAGVSVRAANEVDVCDNAAGAFCCVHGSRKGQTGVNKDRVDVLDRREVSASFSPPLALASLDGAAASSEMQSKLRERLDVTTLPTTEISGKVSYGVEVLKMADQALLSTKQ